ncbi:FMN-dependent NADH-azoreductase [Erythrobacter sp. HA6-11]
MSTVLHITASIRSEESISRGLSTKIVEGLAERENATIITRDLADNTLPYVSTERFAANGTPPAERTAEQQQLAAIADELIDELQRADTIVMGIPIYNFGVPATVKAWADLVARAGTTFKYTENGPVGLLEGKKVYLAVASGGTEVGSAIDFMTPWLKQFFGFLGLTDVEIVAADGIMGAGGEEKIAEAKAEAARLAA